MKKDLVGRVGKITGYPEISRDYDLPIIPCFMAACPANKYEKCTMPTLIRIGADARCKTGVDFLTK